MRCPRLLASLLASLVVLAALFFASCGGSGGSDVPTPVKVLVIHKGTDAQGLAEVLGALAATGKFTGSSFDAGASPSPGGAALAAFDAALVLGDGRFADGVTLGNDLSTYVDGGGALVLAMWLFRGANTPVPNFPEGLGGVYDVGGYFAIPESATNLDSPNTCTGGPTGSLPLTVPAPTHRILAGGALSGGLGIVPAFNAASLSGLTLCKHHDGIAIASGATLVAAWDDGAPFVATNLIGLAHARTVNLGADVQELATSSATFQVVANALLWACGRL